MRIIINNVYQPSLDGSTVTITNSASDPVPTCNLSLIDNTSSINPQFMQELLVLDDQVIPNPAINMLLNPSLNLYTTSWTAFTPTGATLSQVGGGGLNVAVSSSTFVPTTSNVLTQTLTPGSIVGGQSYVFSVFVQGSSTPTNIGAALTVNWTDIAGISLAAPSLLGTIPTSTSLTRISGAFTAPANAAIATLSLAVRYANGTNSGTITFTQPQFEPLWLPTLSYPTPWCGPSQTNCRQLPLGLWIRQYRKFAGFVLAANNHDYHGNARTVDIQAYGYAWLLSTTYCNNSYTTQYDSYIFSNLLATYLTSNGVAMVNTTSVVQGSQFSNFASNWDDLRTLTNNLASQSTFYWTIDFYWNGIYAPLGYNTMSISLICDGSSVPDMVTTFPAYAFQAGWDFTQPGATVFVFGSTGNAAKIMDPAMLATIAANSGYYLPTGNSFARKINESSLQSVADCTQRGMAELLQSDGPRYLYQLTTNVELLAGQAIAVTSNTDNLKATTLLIQQVTATWIGTNETRTDVWEYAASLGAVNRAVTSILSRLFRASNSNTSAPTINTTTLAIIERIGVLDGPPSTGSAATGYQAVIVGDSPLAYYRLNELLGTIADDFSGNAHAGTLNGGITLGATGMLHSGGDPAMTFNGSSGYISLPTGFIPTGAHAWTLEAWCKFTSLPATGYYELAGFGTNSITGESAHIKLHVTGGVATFVCSTYNQDVTSSAVSVNTIYHVVGTYDGTNQRLYVNGSLVAGPTAFTVNVIVAYASIGADGTSVIEFFPGTLDEVALYNTALSAGQISAHYTAGTI